MTLGAVGSIGAMTSALLSKGLSSDKARLVEDELAQSVTASTSLSGTVDGARVRAKLDEKLSADVASGKLTTEDAAAISKVLDEAEKAATETESADAAPTEGAAKGGGPRGGGGGGGGSAEKTELSRTVEIAGSIKTTTIKYTDGTSETKSRFTTDKSAKEERAATASTDANARDWLANIEPGSLVDKLA